MHDAPSIPSSLYEGLVVDEQGPSPRLVSDVLKQSVSSINELVSLPDSEKKHIVDSGPFDVRVSVVEESITTKDDGVHHQSHNVSDSVFDPALDVSTVKADVILQPEIQSIPPEVAAVQTYDTHQPEIQSIPLEDSKIEKEVEKQPEQPPILLEDSKIEKEVEKQPEQPPIFLEDSKIEKEVEKQPEQPPILLEDSTIKNESVQQLELTPTIFEDRTIMEEISQSPELPTTLPVDSMINEEAQSTTEPTKQESKQNVVQSPNLAVQNPLSEDMKQPSSTSLSNFESARQSITEEENQHAQKTAATPEISIQEPKAVSRSASVESSRIFVVKHPHHAEALDELELEIGDRLEADSKLFAESEYWWKGMNISEGKRFGEQGFFPKHCVQSSQDEENMYDTQHEVDSVISGTIEEELTYPDPVPPGTKVIAKYAYEPLKADELELSEGDVIVVLESPEGGWWKGTKNLNEKIPKSGWFPTTLITVESSSPIVGSKSSIDSSSKKQLLSSRKSQDETDKDEPSKKGVSWLSKLVPENNKNKIKRGRSVSESQTSIGASSLSVSTTSSEDPKLSEPLKSPKAANRMSFLSRTLSKKDKNTVTESSTSVTISNELPLIKPDESDSASVSTLLTSPKIEPHKRSFSEPPASGIQSDEMQSSMTLASRPSIKSRPNKAGATRSVSMVFSEEWDDLDKADILRGSIEEEWQSRFDPEDIKKMTNAEKRRLSAIWELIQTERDYVRDLGIVIEVYLRPINALKNVPPKTVLNIFANIEQLLVCNRKFRAELEQIEDLNDLKSFADCFIASGERFLCYIPFCANHVAQATKISSLIVSTKDMRAIVDEANKNPIMRQMDLGGFLIKPVQRICKYPLLIREIIKNTDASHPDYAELKRALERMQQVVSVVNDCAKRMNGLKPVADVVSLFKQKINIVNKHRYLVREDLVQVEYDGGQRKARKLFLFNDLIILATRDWRDKHSILEKTGIKDFRVCEITGSTNASSGSENPTGMIEMEILPSSEFDMPNRYVFSFPALVDKKTWLEAYTSLSKHTINSKLISEVAMTSTSKEAGDDDDVERSPVTGQGRSDEEVKSLNAKIAELQTKLAEAEQQHQKTITEKTAQFDKDKSDFSEKLIQQERLLESERQNRAEEASKTKEIYNDLDKKFSEQKTLLDRIEAELESSKNQIKIKDAEINQGALKAEQSFAKLKELDEALDTARSRIVLKDTELDSLKQQLTLKSEELVKRDKTVDALNQTTAQYSEKIASLTSSLQDTNEKKQKVEQDYRTATQNLSDKASDLVKTSRCLDEANAKIQGLTSNVSQLELKLREVRQLADEREVQLAIKENNIKELQGVMSNATQRVNEKESKISELDRVIKDVKSRLAETESSLQVATQKLTQKDLFSGDLESVIKDLKTKYSEAQMDVSQLQTKLSQKDSRITEVEKEFREFKSRLSDSETSYSSLQQKFVAKEAKLTETESQLMTSQSQNMQLKQKLADTELLLDSAQSKLTDHQTKLKKADAQIATGLTVRTSLEQKVAELKIMNASLLDNVTKVERERKDLSSETERLNHDIGLLNKEVRQLRENIKDMQSDFEKADNQRTANIREAHYQLTMAEDKWKGLLDNEKREHSSAIAALGAEYQAYKLSSTSEISRMKVEHEMNLKMISKEGDDKLEKQRDQAEQRYDQLRKTLESEREASITKAREEREQAVKKLQDQIEAIKETYHTTQEGLQKTINQTLQKLNDTERSLESARENIIQKEEQILELNKQIDRHSQTIHDLQLSLKDTKDSYERTSKSLEHVQQDYSNFRSKKEADIDQLRAKIDALTDRGAANDLKISKLEEDLSLKRREVENAKEEMEDASIEHQAEVQKFEQKITNMELSAEHLKEELSQQKANNVTLVDNIRKVTAEKSDLEEKIYKMQLDINQLKLEKETVITEKNHLTKDFEKLQQEYQQKIALETSLKDTLSKKNTDLNDLSLKYERTELQIASLQREKQSIDGQVNDLRIKLSNQVTDHENAMKNQMVESYKLKEHEMQVLRNQLQFENANLLHKLEDEFQKKRTEVDIAHQKDLSDYDAQKQQLNARIETFEKLEAEWSALKAQLVQEITSANEKIIYLVNRLEEKSKSASANKKRIRELEKEMLQVNEQVSQLSQSRKDLTSKVTDLSARNEKLEADYDTIQRDNSNYQKLETELRLKLAEYIRVEQDYRALKEQLRTFEETNSNEHKQKATCIKLLVSAQMTLVEISSIMGIAFPTESIDIPTKRLDKSGNTIALLKLDNDYLTRVVSGVSDCNAKNQRFDEILNAQKAKLLEYKKLQHNAQKELQAASTALDSIENRVRDREMEHQQDREELIRQISGLESTIANMKKIEDENDVKVQKLADRLKSVEGSKKDIENKFMQLYERFQNEQRVQEMNLVEFSEKHAILMQAKDEVERYLADAVKQNTVTNDKLRMAETDRQRLRDTVQKTLEQKSKVQELLDGANDTAKYIAIELDRSRDQILHMKDEINQLKQERDDLKKHLKLVMDNLNKELARAKDETIALVSERSTYQQLTKERDQQMQKLEARLSKAESQERELYDKAFNSQNELKQERMKNKQLEVEVNQIRENTAILEKRLQKYMSRSRGITSTEISEVLPLVHMVEQLINYEPEYEQQQRMQQQLEQLKRIFSIS